MADATVGFAELFSAVSMLSYSVFGWIFAVRLLLAVRGAWPIPEVSPASGYLLSAGLGYPMAAAFG